MSAEIAINMVSQTASFIDSVNKGAKALEDIGHSAEGAEGHLSKFTEGLEIGGGIEVAKAGIELVQKGFELAAEAIQECVKTLADWSNEAMNSAVATSKVNQVTGISVEVLQALGAAGKLANIDSEQTNSTLEKMTRTIGTLAIHGGEAAKTLQRFGLDAAKLAAEGGDQKLDDIANAFNRIKDASDKATLAAALGMGRSLDVVTLLSKGADGLRDMVKEGKETGEVIAGIDFGTMLGGARTIKELEGKFDGMKNKIVLELMPGIIGVGEGILSILPPADKLGETFGSAARKIIIGTTGAADAVSHFLAPVIELNSKMLQFESTVIRLDAKLLGFIQWLAQASTEVPILGGVIQNVADTITEELDGIFALAKEVFGWISTAINALPGQSNSTLSALADFGDKDASIQKSIADAMGSSHLQSSAIKMMDDMLAHSKEVGAEMQKNLLTGKEAGSAVQMDGAAASAKSIAEAHKQAENAIRSMRAAAEEKAGDPFARYIEEYHKLKELGAGADDLFSFEKQLSALRDITDQHKKAAEIVADQKHRIEEAKHLWEEAETPVQKYNDRLKELNDLLQHGALNQVQFNQAAAKAKIDMEKAELAGHHPNDDKHAELMSRRFTFDLPGQKDPSKNQMLDLAKKNDQRLQQWDTYIQQMYQVITQAGGTPSSDNISVAIA